MPDLVLQDLEGDALGEGVADAFHQINQVPAVQTAGSDQKAVVQWLEGRGILLHLTSIASGPGQPQWGETLLGDPRTV